MLVLNANVILCLALKLRALKYASSTKGDEKQASTCKKFLRALVSLYVNAYFKVSLIMGQI